MNDWAAKILALMVILLSDDYKLTENEKKNMEMIMKKGESKIHDKGEDN